MVTVAIARVWHEANSFSPLPTRLADFRRREWCEGDDADRLYRGTRTEIGGAIRVADGHPGVQFSFLLCCAAPPGGIVEAAAAQAIRERLLAAIERGPGGAGARAWDGVYVSLHGAMISEDAPSFELELLRAVRARIGTVPVAASFDLHANLAPEVARLADIVCGYRTYPHVDMDRTGGRTLQLLLRAIRGEIRPVVGLAKAGVMLPSHRMRTDSGPMREIEDEADRLAQREGALDVTPFGGFVYGDSPFAGASVAVTVNALPRLDEPRPPSDGLEPSGRRTPARVAKSLPAAMSAPAEATCEGGPVEATCEGGPVEATRERGPVEATRECGQVEAARERAHAIATWLGAFIAARRERFEPALEAPGAAIDHALAIARLPGKPVALVEPSDNPLSGGVADTTGLFRALLAHDLRVPWVFAFFFDPDLAQRAHRAGVGAAIDCALGGRLAPQFGAPVRVLARVERVTDGRLVNLGPMEAGLAMDLGPTAVLAVGDARVVIASACQSPNDPAWFDLHGIDLGSVALLAVKAKNHFRAAFAERCTAILDVDTPGPATAAWRSLPFRRVPRPLLERAASPVPGPGHGQPDEDSAIPAAHRDRRQACEQGRQEECSPLTQRRDLGHG